mgnify:FL=1
MKTLSIICPHEAPVCMDTLLDYINTWHDEFYVKKAGQFEIKVDEEILDSERFILRKHFPWVTVDILN